MMRLEKPNPEKKLETVLEELAMHCTRYLNSSLSKTSASGKTKLDVERLKLCQQEIVRSEKCVFI